MEMGIPEVDRRENGKMKKQINCMRFEGWVIICPECGYKDYVNSEDIAFDPMDDRRHIVQCEKCKQDFEIISY